MTYNVLTGTLNAAHPLTHLLHIVHELLDIIHLHTCSQMALVSGSTNIYTMGKSPSKQSVFERIINAWLRLLTQVLL